MLGWLPALTSKLLMPKSLGLSVTLHGTIPGHKSVRHPDYMSAALALARMYVCMYVCVCMRGG